MPRRKKDAAEYILPLNMNGLNGRMVKVPSKSKTHKREMLFIAGQHTSIERISGLVEYLSNFGNVTSPDLPGFGGMDAMYEVGRKPTLDNMADYLAAFVKLRYKNKRLSIIAVSYGFAVVTRMLQKYPEIVKKIDLLVSISGIVNKSDFRWKRRNIFIMKNSSRLLSLGPTSWVAKHTAIRAPVIKALYKIAEDKHPKLRDADPAVRKQRIDFEIKLWRSNDFRTWMETCVTMFTLDLTGSHVDLMVYHVAIQNDHYFDNTTVELSMRSIYKDFMLLRGKGQAHVPTIVATPKEAQVFIPEELRKILAKKR